MKRNRILILILWVVSLITISNIGGMVSYCIFYMITAIPVFSLLYVLVVYIQFRIYQQVLIANIVAGQPTPFVFKLQNDTKFAFAGIRIHFFSFFSQILDMENHQEYELLPGETIHKETQMICRYRGDYPIGIETLEITDYLRLITIRFRPKETVIASVKPAVVHLEELHTLEITTSFPREIVMNPTIPDSVCRDYTPSDPMRLINWNATARTHSLQVRKLLGEDQQGISLLMDTFRCSDAPETYLPMESKVLETVIALSLFMVKKYVELEICYMADSTRRVSMKNLAAFDDFYAEISQISFDKEYGMEKKGTAFLEDMKLQKSGMVIMVLQEMTENCFRLADQLLKENVQVVVYLIEQENGAGKTDVNGMQMKLFPIGVNDSLKEVI